MKTPGCRFNPKYVAGMAPEVLGDCARGRRAVAERRGAALGPEVQPAGGGGGGDVMIWEDEFDPPSQAVPNQQESNNIDKEIAGKRLPNVPLE